MLSANVGSMRSAVIVGVGNIGSFAAELLARQGLQRLTLVDRDVFEPQNLASQHVGINAIGMPKAAAVAEQLRQSLPGVAIDALADDVETLPLARLRADVILACVDSRRARQAINERAWRLGVPWIDSGVQGDGLLARVHVFMPGGDDASCLECGFDERDYALLEQVYICNGDVTATPASGSPAALGALAASLQVIECRKLLAGALDQLTVGKQIIFDARWQKHMVSRLRRLRSCRFDHHTWHIEFLNRSPQRLSWGELCALGRPDTSVGVAGQIFVRRLTCPRCAATHELPWRLSGRLGALATCAACGRRLLASASDSQEWLGSNALNASDRARPLSESGLLRGDVLTLRTAAGDRHIELAGAQADDEEVLHG